MADMSKYSNASDVLTAIEAGDISPYEGQVYLTNMEKAWANTAGLSDYWFGNGNPWTITPEQEKTLNNLISRYQSQNALNWQAEQLQTLGLSNAGVLQTGAARTASDMSNQANNRANRANNIAQAMIGMAGRMASSGIYGASLSAVKGAASQAASTVAHSATAALKLFKHPPEYWAQPDNDDSILKVFENR